MKQVPLPGCPPPPAEEELFRLYVTTFELWAHSPNTISSIEPLDTMIRGLLGEQPRSCSFAASCPEHMITIDQNGNVVPCSSLVSEEFVLGNIFSEKLQTILEKPSTKDLSLSRAGFLGCHCADCEFLSLCQGGCRADAYWHSGRYDGAYPYCESRKRTFAYLRDRLADIAPRVS